MEDRKRWQSQAEDSSRRLPSSRYPSTRRPSADNWADRAGGASRRSRGPGCRSRPHSLKSSSARRIEVEDDRDDGDSRPSARRISARRPPRGLHAGHQLARAPSRRLHLESAPLEATREGDDESRHRRSTADVDRAARLERRAAEQRGRPRILATICWNFPIYSQTFVYEELTQLLDLGLDLRIVYSLLDPRDQLPTRTRLCGISSVVCISIANCTKRTSARYRRRAPAKVEALIEKLSQASGLSPQAVATHDNFLRASPSPGWRRRIERTTSTPTSSTIVL